MQKNPKVLQRSGYDPEDLTIVPLGGNISGGRFVIANRENPVDTLRDDKGEVAVITLGGLRQVAGQMAERGRQEARQVLRQSLFNNSVQQKGFVHVVDIDGSTKWIDPKSKEVYEFQYTDKDDAPIWKKTGKRYSRAVVVDDRGATVFKGYEAGKDWGRLRGSDLKEYRERMKKMADDHDAKAAERRKFWGGILPSIKIGDKVLND